MRARALHKSTVTPLADFTNAATGVAYVYEAMKPDHYNFSSTTSELASSYFIISVAVNVLLTLMIVIRLVLCGRNIRKAVGATVGASEVYKGITTILVESSALYAVALLLYTGAWFAGSIILPLFAPIASWAQVRAAFMYLNLGALFLIVITFRSSLRSSSPCESPTRES